MHTEHDDARRRFLRTTLRSAGIIAIGCPWGLHTALATVPGRALIGFQVLPSWMQYFAAILAEIRGQYDPDLGVKAVVVPGGAGTQALETVQRSPRDGGTVLISPSTVLTMTPALRKTPVDQADDPVPVAGIGEIPFGFIVGPAVPASVRSVSDYFAWVRANPASNRYGVPGLGTAPHFVGSELIRLADVPMRAVGYKGSLALAEDVASGNMPAGLTVLLGPDDIAHYPQLRLLAVAGNRRLARSPDVPTLPESGFPVTFPGESLGLFLPGGTPESKVRQLNAVVREAMQTQPVLDAMARAAISPMPTTDVSYAATISAERALWQTLVTRHDFNGQG